MHGCYVFMNVIFDRCVYVFYLTAVFSEMFYLTTVISGVWEWWWVLNLWWTSRVANLPRRLQRSSVTSQSLFSDFLVSYHVIMLTVFTPVYLLLVQTVVHILSSASPPHPFSFRKIPVETRKLIKSREKKLVGMDFIQLCKSDHLME